MTTTKPKLLVLASGMVLCGVLTMQPTLAGVTAKGSVAAKQVTKDAVADAEKAAQQKKAEYRDEVITALRVTNEALALLESASDRYDLGIRLLTLGAVERLRVGDRVLDLGCGTGALTLRAVEQARKGSMSTLR